ncbi:zinc metalloprotease HtpX [Catenulispora yoronensis]|uniref:Protease HtpX homolog n=1 Tax=Catenulispora yoronensis TaxID=450799 RepID=A0ABP5GVI5_9ACTN
MARTRFAPDRQLTSRMVTVMFLLGAVYVAAIGVAVAFAPKGLLPILLIVIAGFFFAQWYLSDKIALFSMNARVVQPDESAEAHRLHAVLDRLCALADMPKPRVGLVDTEVPNAFAAGRSSKNTVVVATTGLMRRVPDDRELEAVLAHELSHVAHKDVAVMTIASFLGVLAGLITRVTFEIGLWGGFSDRRDRDDEDSPAAVLFLVMIVSMITYALSFLLIRSLSRYRELAADRSGAMLTGNPTAMSNALGRITGEMAQIPTQDLRKQEAFNAFFFTPAIRGGASVSNLFSTHPSLQVRQEKLAQLAVEMGR